MASGPARLSDRVYISIRKGPRKLSAATGASRRMAHPGRCVLGCRDRAGGSDDGPPGLRDYHASYYAAFLRDPDGNRIEAVCHHPV